MIFRLHFLQTEKLTDCRFLVGMPPNQKLITAHKLVLAMSSPVFERMFYGLLAEKDNPIVITDVQPDAFQAMLEYVYSDRINIDSLDKACGLCYVAKKYMLPQVVDECTYRLLAYLYPKNACRIYEFAKLFDAPDLMQSSLNLILSKTKEVLQDPSFSDIEVSTLMTILDQNNLNIDSELDLFNALLRFSSKRGMFLDEFDIEVIDSDASIADVSEEEAVAEATVVSSSTSNGQTTKTEVTDAGSAANLTTSDLQNVGSAANLNYFLNAQHSTFDEVMLREAIKKIRFLTMTPQQFAEGPARSKLLKQHEAFAILMKISSNNCPMPKGFSTSRSKRNYCAHSHQEVYSPHSLHSGVPLDCITRRTPKVSRYNRLQN